MRILVSENQMKKLIKEDLGVSRPSIAYANLTLNKVEPILLKLINQIGEKEEKIETEVKIGLDEIKKIWQNDIDDFLELPIEMVHIELILEKEDRVYDNITFATGGGAYGIRKNKLESYLKSPSLSLPKKILDEPEVNKTLVCRIELVVSINLEFEIKDFQKLILDLRDTIVHEFNHVIEIFRKYEKGSELDTRLSHIKSNSENIPEEIQNVWNYFLELVEYTQPQEINAMTQEMYSKKLRMSFDELKQTRYWKFANYMKNFDADTYFDFLVAKLESHTNEKKVSYLTEMYNSFIIQYNVITKLMGFKPSKVVSKSKHIYELIKNFQPRIQNSGKKLLKNFIRLYGLEES